MRRPSAGLLGGMWAFPEREIGAPKDALDAACSVAEEVGLSLIGAAAALPACEHKFTHLHVTYVPYAAEVVEAAPMGDSAWTDAWRPTRLALPVAQQKVLESFRELASAEVT